MRAQAPAATTDYVQTDIPPGMTIAEYRRHRRSASPSRHSPISLLVASALATAKRAAGVKVH